MMASENDRFATGPWRAMRRRKVCFADAGKDTVSLDIVSLDIAGTAMLERHVAAARQDDAKPYGDSMHE
jgi:hypothetical protein